MVQGKINRGRDTDNPAWRPSIRTNQCPLPPSLQFLQAGCPSCRPTNGVKALKAGLVQQEGQHPLTGQRAANFRLLANQ